MAWVTVGQFKPYILELESETTEPFVMQTCLEFSLVGWSSIKSVCFIFYVDQKSKMTISTGYCLA